jgi:hypothetical protein
MKRTGIKQQKTSQLNQRLELVRMTIRELTPDQLKHVGGGTGGKVSKLDDTGCGPFTE